MVIQKTHYEGQTENSVFQFHTTIGGIKCATVIDSDADAFFRVIDAVIDKSNRYHRESDIGVCNYYDNLLAVLDAEVRSSFGYINIDCEIPNFKDGRLYDGQAVIRNGRYGIGWYLVSEDALVSRND